MTEEEGGVVKFESGTVAGALNSGDMKILSSPTTEERYGPELRESLEKAKEILGPYFLGPREVKEAFNITLEPESIPKIPFTNEELNRARALDQRLILRINKTPYGEPITMRWLNEQFLPYSNAQSNVVLQSMDKKHCEEDYFFKEEVPRVGWALVSNNKIPSPSHSTYIGHTQDIVNYLKNQVFGGLKSSEIPDEYSDAFIEFEIERERLTRLIASNNIFSIPGGLTNLTDLKISRLTRHSAVEVLYDYLLSCMSFFKVKLFNNEAVYTSSISSHNLLLAAGETRKDEMVIGELGANLWTRSVVSYLSRRADI